MGTARAAGKALSPAALRWAPAEVAAPVPREGKEAAEGGCPARTPSPLSSPQCWGTESTVW